MGIIGSIRGRIAESRRKREEKLDAAIKLRRKSLPAIRAIAKQYHASVEVFDNSAYVYKTVGGKQRGAYIQYGMSTASIDRKLSAAFVPSATASRIVRGAKTGVKAAKSAHKTLKKTLGSGRGNMYTDPNFFKGFG